MHDLVIKLDNLLKDRRDTIAIIDKLKAKFEDDHAPNLWERAIFALAQRTKRSIDHDIAATFNKMSQHTDGHALKSFITLR
jgi:hypothetical protein